MEAQRASERECQEAVKKAEAESKDLQSKLFQAEKECALSDQKLSFIESQISRMKQIEDEARESANKVFQLKSQIQVFVEILNLRV